ncbi:MAG: hypothetical protein U0L12_08735 [Ruminococcus sp.]|nr:hypothetical protein [Ruminococcus sp.]
MEPKERLVHHGNELYEIDIECENRMKKKLAEKDKKEQKKKRKQEYR